VKIRPPPGGGQTRHGWRRPGATACTRMATDAGLRARVRRRRLQRARTGEHGRHAEGPARVRLVHERHGRPHQPVAGRRCGPLACPGKPRAGAVRAGERRLLSEAWRYGPHPAGAASRSTPSRAAATPSPRPATHGWRLLGHSNRDIHAANEIWEFFHSVP